MIADPVFPDDRRARTLVADSKTTPSGRIDC
jgi:hypothetical protein